MDSHNSALQKQQKKQKDKAAEKINLRQNSRLAVDSLIQSQELRVLSIRSAESIKGEGKFKLSTGPREKDGLTLPPQSLNMTMKLKPNPIYN